MAFLARAILYKTSTEVNSIITALVHLSFRYEGASPIAKHLQQHNMAYQPSYPQPGYPGQPSPSGYPAPSPGYPGQAPTPGYPGHHHQSSFSGSAPPPGPPPSHGAPPPQAAAGASNLPTTGQIEGVQFRIDHRDSNSMLYLRLQPGAEVKAKPGSMVAMDATVKIKGKLKFSVKKLLTGGEVRGYEQSTRVVVSADGDPNSQMSESIFTGPGEVMVAPETWGDIVPIHLDGRTQWSVGRDAYLACTMGVSRTTKSQGVGKALCTFYLSRVGIQMLTLLVQSPAKACSCTTWSAAV